MNQKAAYEITIAEKLEQLSVPDMVDAIWARIETQLDIDMPTDDGPANPPGNPSPGNGLWNMTGLVLFIAALVAVIYFTNKKTNTTNNEIESSSNTNPIITAPGNTKDKSPPPNSILPSQQQSSPGLNADRPAPLIADSTNSQANEPVNIPVINTRNVVDSSFSVPPPIVTVPDTTKKKGRGVKGISDNDYRITPTKKDST